MTDKFYEKRHPDYQTINRSAQFLRESYIGGFTYRNEKNLLRYKNEGIEKYSQRLDRSFPVNFLGPIINELVNSIFSQPIRRDAAEKSTMIARFIKNASGDKSLSKVMLSIATIGSYANVGVLIEGGSSEMIESLGLNKEAVNKDIKEKYKLFPQVKIFPPERILNWSITNSLNWVLLDYSYRDDTDYNNIQDIKKYVLWTKNTWVTYTFSKHTSEPVIDEQFHNLGFVPFRFFTQFDINGNLVSSTVYEDIALQQKAVYQWHSLIDENFNSVIFPILLVQNSSGLSMDSAEDEAKQAGSRSQSFKLTDNLLFYEKDCNPPQLLKTDFVNVSAILSEIDAVTKEIFRKVGKYLDSNNVYAQSGVAKEIDNEQRINNLQNFSRQLEELENWMLEVYCKYENTEFKEDYMTVYPREFDIRSIKDKILEAIDLKTLFQGKSATAVKLILKDLLEKKYSHVLTKEEREAISRELDEVQEVAIIPDIEPEE